MRPTSCVLLVISLGGCAGDDGSEPPPTGLEFRATTAGFVAIQATHAVTVANGAATLTPIVPVEDGSVLHGDPLTLETVALSVDGQDFARAPHRLAMGASNVTITRGPIVERWTNRLDGVEQEWVFDTAFTGALSVEVAARGERFVSANEGGLHFAGGSGIGFRYSHATWVDAAGSEIAIPASYVDGRIRLIVPQEVIAATRFPATLDPTVSPELAMDEPIVATTGRAASTPAVAFDGKTYLVVWADARDDSLSTDIWGTRVSVDGEILDPTGIPIAVAPGIQSNPAVAFDGSQYVVVWENFKVAGGRDADIAAAIVTPGGEVKLLLPIAASKLGEKTPTIASNGNGTIIAWSVDGQILATRFAGDLGGTFEVTRADTIAKDPAVSAAPDGGYLVAFTATNPTTGDDIRGQLVGADGALAGDAFDVSVANGVQGNPAATFAGSSFQVVWRHKTDIYGSRVSSDGRVLDTHVEATRTVGGKVINRARGGQTRPTIGCDPSGCVVGWEDRRAPLVTGYDVYAQQLTPDFDLIDGERLISTGPADQVRVRIAGGRELSFAVWQDLRTGMAEILGTRIKGGELVDGEGIELVRGYNQQHAPTLARSESTVAVGWSDSRGIAGNDIEMRRFDSTGSALDAEVVTVSAAPLTQRRAASVGFGSSFLYVWSDFRNGLDNNIYAARVDTATGTLLDEGGIEVTTARSEQLVPQVAASDSEALVVWQDRSSNTSYDIVGALINRDGGVAAPFVICDARGDQTAPAVAYDAETGQYVVVWVDAREGGPARSIEGARVDRSGQVLDPDSVVVASSKGARSAPRIAVSGATVLVVYEDLRNGNSDVYATRMTAGDALTVNDPAGIVLCKDRSAQLEPTVASVGKGFFVAWSDARAFAERQRDIWAQLVDVDGRLVDGNFVVSATREDEWSVAAIDLSPSAVRVAYNLRLLDLHAARVVTRTIDLP